MTVHFRAIEEDSPGPKWSGLFAEYWPAYRAWWSREGLTARPTYRECFNALKRWMPEMLDLYEELCELAGGGDAEARFLSFFCPPRYLAGCSQAVWPVPIISPRYPLWRSPLTSSQAVVLLPTAESVPRMAIFNA